MSLPEGGGSDGSSNSGDVVIETWSDDDSDVICLDSEVSNNISSQVSEKRLFIKEETAGDSDDCVILEDEIIDAVNQNDQNKKAPGTLDCKSFADFKEFGDQLVTSTPKRRQPQPESAAKQAARLFSKLQCTQARTPLGDQKGQRSYWTLYDHIRALPEIKTYMTVYWGGYSNTAQKTLVKLFSTFIGFNVHTYGVFQDIPSERIVGRITHMDI